MKYEEVHCDRMSDIERMIQESKAYKLVSREFHEEDTLIKVNGVTIGGKKIIMIAGPCSVENEVQLIETAKAVKQSGAQILRGGAYKPRTSVYSFQGLGEDGLKLLLKAKKETGLPFVTEIMSPDKVKLVAKYADILQIGCRNMQNYDLLMEVGKVNKPVVLKRGFNSTLKEFLLSAEYIMSQGNSQIVLCERGIRTFETMTRNTLDISAVPILKNLSHLPVMVDPSHATGKRELILPMSRAAVAVGADVIMIEVHHKPEKALCDGEQSLHLDEFDQIMKGIKPIIKCMGREI
jgi:3-deoxy-7-phosphoheptulonate synthase